MRAHHLALRVRDVPRVAEFYRDVLQLEVIAAPRPGVVWFRLDPLVLMIEPLGADAELADRSVERPGFHLLALSIEPNERAAWEQRLHALDVPIMNRTDYTLYIRDPEGNRVGLSHYPAPVSLDREQHRDRG